MENEKEIITKDFTEKLSKLRELEQTQDFLKNNKTEFLYKEKTYRVHKPVAFEKDLVNKERMKKYIEFLQEPKYLFKKQLVALLEAKGVNITKMESEATRLFKEEQELLKKLAMTTMQPDINILKKDINELRDLQTELFIEKEELLKFCIEKQLEDFVRFYLLYVVLEVKIGTKSLGVPIDGNSNNVTPVYAEVWEKVYKTYEEFQKADDDLMLGRAAQILATLVYNESF